jgi:hypothetical protein
MTFFIPDAHRIVRSAATLARATTGAGTSRIQFFDTPQPSLGDDPGASPLVEIVLTAGVGTVSAAGVITLAQADVAGDLISTQGNVVWGRWLARDGSLMGDGTVTESAGDGFFKLSGTTGTLLYAGARAVLGVTALG